MATPKKLIKSSTKVSPRRRLDSKMTAAVRKSTVTPRRVTKTLLAKADIAAPAPSRKKNETRSTRLSKAALLKRNALTATKDTPIADSVILPTNASVRIRAKVRAIMQMIDSDIYEAACTVSRAGALSLFAIGTAVLSVSFFVFPDEQAAAICEGLICSTTNAGTTSPLEPINSSDVPEESSAPQPSIEVHTTIPTNLLSETSVVFRVTATDRVTATIKSLTTGTIYPIEPELFAEQYRILLSPSRLPPGEYRLRIVVRNESAIRDWSSRSWFILPPKEQLTEREIVTTSTSTSTTAVPTGRVATSTISDDEQLPLSSTIPTTPVAATSSSAEIVPAYSVTPLSISVLPKNDRDMIPLLIQAPTSTIFIEIHARRANALTPQFIGLAERRATDWIFFWDTTKMPSDSYEVFALTTRNDSRLRSKSVIVAWQPPRLAVATDSNSSPNEVPLREERPLVTISESARTQQSTTTEVTENITSGDTQTESESAIERMGDTLIKATSTLPISVVPITNQILELEQSYSTEIDEILKRLAAAHQANNQLLIEATRKELSELRIEIVSSAVADETLRPFISTLDEALSSRMEMYAQRVETFERIRSERKGELTAKDTDSDGISDLDEVLLFGTDSTVSDTDNDGITDGVEIVRGYNPTSAAPEALIVYEDPRTVPITASEVLFVDKVAPVEVEAPETPTYVAAEIRGRALPNSYVTIYIFSEPTIITVRTESDGSFSYRFDRELPDGRHEVYVALTDNAGAVIARSEPFAFVKTAQAFAPVDELASSARTVTPATERVVVPFAPAVIGISMLTLGLILLALGASLRMRPPVARIEST